MVIVKSCNQARALVLHEATSKIESKHQRLCPFYGVVRLVIQVMTRKSGRPEDQSMSLVLVISTKQGLKTIKKNFKIILNFDKIVE